MKFCTECGNEVKEEQTFCTSCGNNLKNESTNKTQPVKAINLNKESKLAQETNSTEESITPSIKLTKKSKIVIAVVIVFIVAIVAIIQVGNYLSDPKKLETRFQNDVVTNNTSDLASILYCNDSRLTVDSKSIAPLLDYFKNNPSYYDEVIQNLNNDVPSPKDISKLNIASSNTLTLTNVGKKFLVFPNYKINIKPSFLNITTTVKDVTFSLNDTQIGKSDTDKFTKEFGPYIPGTYSILANYKGKYVTLSKPYPINLVDTTGGIAKISVFDDMNYINITSDYPDAEIFVNGKDANVKVKDATNFGPVDGSSKIYATNVIDGKKLRSEEYSATSAADINISFQDSINAINDAQAQLSEVQSQLDTLLINYASALTDAINTNNFSLIDPYLTYGSELYKQQKSAVPNSYVEGNMESYLSANVTNYNISDDSQSGSIATSETYNFLTKDGVSSNKTYNHVYRFQYNTATSSYQFTQRQ